jgi:hypothetical protein
MKDFVQKLEAMTHDKTLPRGTRIEISKDMLWYIFNKALWDGWLDEGCRDDMERIEQKYEKKMAHS